MILPGVCPVSQLEITSRLHGVDAELDFTPKASAPPSPRKPRAEWLKSSLLLGATGMDQGCRGGEAVYLRSGEGDDHPGDCRAAGQGEPQPGPRLMLKWLVGVIARTFWQGS